MTANAPKAIYLVGGAVRDELLGIPVKDRDWLVTGYTPEEMLAQGYQQVGKQFPVFLHPKTKDEYALARTERKQGQGYTGFTCDFSPSITVDEDLLRRDLTINAIAKTENGQLIDPYGGRRDIQNRVLRHVSDAFIEDPLRVLRVARFLARFAHLGFEVAPETLALLKSITASGELQSLTTERVWRETENALNAANPARYFELLQQIGALEGLFPQFVLPNLSPQDLSSQDLDTQEKWALFTAKVKPEALTALHERLRSPNQYRWLSEHTNALLNLNRLSRSAEEWESWLTQVGAVKRMQPFQKLVKVIAIATQIPAKHWLALRSVIAGVTAKDFIQQGISGAELGAALQAERVARLQQLDSPLINKPSDES